jgi:hypothetical protein
MDPIRIRGIPDTALAVSTRGRRPDGDRTATALDQGGR